MRKAEFASWDFYDVGLPSLASSVVLVKMALRSADQRTWKAFVRRYRAEMRKTDAARTLDLLAALSRTGNFSVGRYCEDQTCCHRSILRELLKEHGANLARE